MVDQLSPKERSAFMARIRSEHTRPELIVRRLAHRLGYRFRLHPKTLPGRPDLTFTKRRKVIFVHGCFWHAHAGCPFAHVPKTRPEYWGEKFVRNRTRDERNLQELGLAGWEALTIWECEVAAPEALAVRFQEFLGPPKWATAKGLALLAEMIRDSR